MQSLIDHSGSQAAIDRHQLRLGILGAALLVVLLAVTAAIYALPLGDSTYTADISEAQSIKAGDEVRMAGIPIGKVTGVELLTDRVRMSFTVDSDVFVGDQSTLDIRMLTLVGGHYAALTSAGSKPLGHKVIPVDHVRLPYSLVRTLQDSAEPVAQVDGRTLRQNLAALQASLATSPDALRHLGRAAESLVAVLNQQNSDVSHALDVSDEFLTTINQSKSLIGIFIRRIGLLERQGMSKQVEIKESLRVTGELLARIAALEPTWSEALEPVLHQLKQAGPQMQQLIQRLDEALAVLRDAQARLQSAAAADGGGLTVDQSAITLTAPAVCVPVPGQGC